VEIINEKIRQIPEFPKDLATMLKHLILSHHGEYAFGSPKRPKTLEALMLNYLDDLDAKMEGLKNFILKEKHSDSKWTSYNKLFDRYIFKETFVDDDPSDSDNTERE
jgi:3'-5' exoribonuclease